MNIPHLYTVEYDDTLAAWVVRDVNGKTVGRTTSERGARLMRSKREQREQS